MERNNKYYIKSRIWICTDNGTFLGEGRVALLEAIKLTGSISSAAKSMDMSYKKAWSLVKSMNSQSSCPLVVKKVGGQGGGGAVLTKTGENVIVVYHRINSSCQRVLGEELINVDVNLNV